MIDYTTPEFVDQGSFIVSFSSRPARRLLLFLLSCAQPSDLRFISPRSSSGYYAVQLESIAVTCSPSQADLVNTTSQSYVYALTNDTSNIPVSSLSVSLSFQPSI